MRFEWDENKNILNVCQHGIDFKDAWQIFESPILGRIDNRKDYGELRYIALGQLKKIIVIIVPTIRQDAIRIISIRKANSREREIYEIFIIQQD